ncbi:MAG: hypothetical protein RL685_1671 [Pseudomonadota bacterium]
MRRVRSIAGAVGLAVWALASVEGWSALAYLSALHGDLGRGTLAAALAVWVLLSALPLTWSLWALRPALDPGLLRLPSTWALAALVTLSCALMALSSHDAARATPTALASLSDAQLSSALHSLGDVASRLRPGHASGALPSARSMSCSSSPEAVPVTLLVSFVPTLAEAARPELQSACLQGDRIETVLVGLRQLLVKSARRGPLWLDWVSGVQPLSGRHSWIDALRMRPGLDGVCASARCLTPGQLLTGGSFSTYRPVSFIPDFQFGVDPAQLREALGAGAGAGLGQLLRVETRSYELRLDTEGVVVTPLLRLRRRDVPLTRATLARAGRAAQGHLLAALLPNGRFRYTLEPFSGAADTEGFNLARQAGALLVLCELGDQSETVRHAIEQASSAFAPFERQAGEIVAFTTDPSAAVARLGESTLPLASLVYCTRRVSALPPAAAGLARLLLALQRPDGGFWPALDLSSAEVQPGPEPLYATGQAVLALVLLEERQRAQFDPTLPTVERLHDAVERAMSYIANDYWSHPLRDFFYLEENWHCLAARAALPVHRHAGYEEFCLRYVRFKARLILEREQGADPDFDGGFGFGNLVPPHNTGAAGFGEALAAALALERPSDGSPANRELLGKVLGFLLRQQWSEENCGACATSAVIGGMSEHTHSLLTRIDFAQHAWAALGHGAEALGSSLPEE